MKTAIGRFLIGAGIIIVANLHAQDAPLVVQYNGSLAPATNIDWNSASDLETMLTAIEQTQPVLATSVSNDPTITGFAYWSAAHSPASASPWPPLPSATMTMGNQAAKVWPLGNNQFLLDDLGYSAKQVKSSSRMLGAITMDGPGAPGDGGDTNDDNGTNWNWVNSGYVPFSTNGLWLQVAGIGNGQISLNLMNATDSVYEIFAKPSLSVAGNWNIAGEVFPTNSAIMPFTVPMSSPTNLFIWSRDWTGITGNGNTTPEWWFYYYYGTTNLSDTNLDVDENTLAWDYTNNIPPAVYDFTGVEVANNYVNTGSPAAQLDVTGSPYYIGISVDDPNYAADANWQVYTGTNITVNLGLTEGWHDVWVGLRGFADAPSDAVWQWTRLKLDYTAPQIVITNPVAGTVDEPVIQLRGYANEALQAISYDLTNACGLATNQQMMVIGQDYNTTAFEFTTNYFQAYDVPLTNGLNVITVHAMDLAGNVSALVTNITLDYSAKTNPPVVQLLWPTNGMEIVGSNIVCRGSVSDPTATVSVQLVDANGSTNTVGSLVGRDGIFYADNLTLAAGTNCLSYTVTDAAGNVATTNILVSTSDLGLTLNPVTAGQTLVTGTIDNTNYTIYVNGVQATNDGLGNWGATITPIGVSGGAVVVNAVAGGDPTLQQIVQPAQGVYISAYHSHEQMDIHDWTLYADAGSLINDNLDWQDGLGGGGEFLYEYYNFRLVPTLEVFNWPSNNWPQALASGVETKYVWTWQNYTNYPNSPAYTYTFASTPSLQQEHRDINNIVDSAGSTDRQTADTEMSLATGGPAGSTQVNLWCISATATDNDTGQQIPYDQIQIGAFGHLDNDGNFWVLLPDNDADNVTPKGGKKNFSFIMDGTKYTLTNRTYYPALTNPDHSRTTLGVGEQVLLGFSPEMPYAMHWTNTAGGLSETFFSSTVFTAPSNATPNVTITASFTGGKSVKFPPFTVVEPTGIDHAQIVGTNHFSIGEAGSIMTNAVWIAPTSVSFNRVQIIEVGLQATNVTGYFTNLPSSDLNHHNQGADHWFYLTSNNEWRDAAGGGPLSPPWTTGGFTWDIPARWKVGNGDTNSMSGWNQSLSIDANGTVTTHKFGNTMTRDTNDVINTN